MAETKPSDAPRDLEAQPAQSSLMQRWKQSVDPKHADLICILLCLVTGLCDSSAYNAWSCFLAMQTGESLSHNLGLSIPPRNPKNHVKD